jgi:hypothetical protein
MAEQTRAQIDTKCQQHCMQKKLEQAPRISGVLMLKSIQGEGKVRSVAPY